MTESQKLLAEYVESQSETAFRELVARYINLVYSTASRLISGDRHLAEDIAQTVFVDLARMAKGLPKDVLLGGWLHRHTCYVTATVMRGERRRQARERKGTEMHSIQDHTKANLAQVAPILDEAINQLGADDRNAILLRFFDQCDFRAIGEALGSSEDAARKRVNRALEKLHTLLQRRGVALSAGALGTVIATEVAAAAPVGLAANITSIALSGAAVSTLTATNLFKFVTITKVKTGILAGIIIAGIATTLLMEQQSQRRLREENMLLRQQVEQMAQLRDESFQFSNVPTQPAPDENYHELLKLRGEVGVLRRELFTKTNNSNGIKVLEPGKEDDLQPSLQPEDVRRILTLESLHDAGLSSPEAAIQTYLWTQRETINTNTWESANERVKQLIWIPPGAKFGGYSKEGKHDPMRDFKFLKIETVTYPTSDTAEIRYNGYDDDSGFRLGSTYRMVREGESWKVDIGLHGK